MATSLKLTVLNPALNSAEVYINTSSILNYTLDNKTNGDLTFKDGETDNYIKITMSSQLFTSSELDGMAIDLTGLPGWSLAKDDTKLALTLTYTGSTPFVLKNGDSMVIPVTGVIVKPDAQAKQYEMEVYISIDHDTNWTEDANLSVLNPPSTENADLTSVLQLSLDNQGMVIVSTDNDPLQNTIFLNIKNIGSTPLYNAQTRSGNPTVSVTFVYGSTVGCLAPDDQSSGSAWNITCGDPIVPGDDFAWGASGPDKNNAFPMWVLSPESTNTHILGTGDFANISFNFENIISNTPPGSTQMVVLFSGFQMDETTYYNDATFTLDIVKINPPPFRGLLSFFSPSAILPSANAGLPMYLDFRWTMFDVAKVRLITSYPGIEPIPISYPNPATIAYEPGASTPPQNRIRIPSPAFSTVVTNTLQAYDGNDSFLNSLQFTIYIQADVFIDPRDSQVYPTVKINNKQWMGVNLNYKTPTTIQNNAEKEYGLLYDWDSAKPADDVDMDGWRLPTEDDWMDLINNYSYAQLMHGVDGIGFNALLNNIGLLDNSSNINYGSPNYGFYWSAVNTPDNADYVCFSQNSSSISYIYANSLYALTKQSLLSVRFVKDLT